MGVHEKTKQHIKYVIKVATCQHAVVSSIIIIRIFCYHMTFLYLFLKLNCDRPQKYTHAKKVNLKTLITLSVWQDKIKQQQQQQQQKQQQ